VDYGKTAAPQKSKDKRRHEEHNAKGTAKNPYGERPARTDLVARLKAAAEARKDK
jgi:hypothetical protein